MHLTPSHKKSAGLTKALKWLIGKIFRLKRVPDQSFMWNYWELVNMPKIKFKMQLTEHTDPVCIEGSQNCLDPALNQINSNLHNISLTWPLYPGKNGKRPKKFWRPELRPGMKIFKILWFFQLFRFKWKQKLMCHHIFGFWGI